MKRARLLRTTLSVLVLLLVGILFYPDPSPQQDVRQQRAKTLLKNEPLPKPVARLPEAAPSLPAKQESQNRVAPPRPIEPLVVPIDRSEVKVTEPIDEESELARLFEKAAPTPSGGRLTEARSNTVESSLDQSKKSNEEDAVRNSDSRIPRGGSLSGSEPAASEPLPLPTEEAPTPEPTPTVEQPPFVSGQYRGYTMLYLMQPEARTTVEQEISTLIEARVRQIFLGVLVDGTFGWDPQYFADVLRRLHEEEREVLLALYMVSGPTMREYDTTPIDTPFSRVSPEEFRAGIQSDESLRESFRRIALRARPLLELNRSLGRESLNLAFPMLEDNLDDDSYRAARGLLDESVGGSAIVARNPCPDCFPGNTLEAPGDPIELHEPEQMVLVGRSGGFSLDGTGYTFAFENTPSELLGEDVEQLMLRSLSQGALFFALWRTDRQGLQSGSGVLPSERRYARQTPLQREAEIELLRFGLDEEP